jgi:hypothetical protein
MWWSVHVCVQASVPDRAYDITVRQFPIIFTPTCASLCPVHSLFRIVTRTVFYCLESLRVQGLCRVCTSDGVLCRRVWRFMVGKFRSREFCAGGGN